MRLWEAKHPYYMNEGNYFQAGQHHTYKLLDNFLEDMGGADVDYNWLVRWDWIEPENRPEDRPDTYMDGTLMLQFIGQRKSMLWSCEVTVCRYDEPRVREYLSKYATYMVAMWEPFDLASVSDKDPSHD